MIAATTTTTSSRLGLRAFNPCSSSSSIGLGLGPRRATTFFNSNAKRLHQNQKRLLTSDLNSRSRSYSQQSFWGSRWTQAGAAGLVGVTLASQTFSSTRYQCQGTTTESSSRPYVTSSPPEPATDSPESIVNIYQLSFGTICGICVGIFIKKGLKFVGFFLGGVFVLLQYLSNGQYIRGVNWGSIGKKYDGLLDRATGSDKDKNKLLALYNRFVHFLTANFQERASLIAGLALGLRIG
ncbi:unnamed protein product [Sympodiomycopsis kandeliae]